ncbi:hypothetical protein V8D89_008195, partial [Ganoderma adspersum]
MATISYHNLPRNDTNANHDAMHDGASEPTDPQDGKGVKAAKAFGIGLACLVGIPVGAALFTAGGVVYGAGKLLEGVGRGLAVGPEAVANAMNQEQAEPAETPKKEEKPRGKKP